MVPEPCQRSKQPPPTKVAWDAHIGAGMSPAKDQYFQGVEGLIEVFDFDYDTIVEYKWGVENNWAIACCLFPLFWPCVPCHILCAKDNLNDKVRAQHLCVTQDGIRYVVDKHKNECRFDCQDKGKVTKTVPFDKLTDCDIEEPAGAEGPCCCMSNKKLYIVNVDTASGNRNEEGGGHELVLEGLVDPKAFKETVWRCKRGGTVHGGSATAPGQQSMLDSAASALGTVFGKVGTDTGSEICRLLERNNQLLEQIAA